MKKISLLEFVLLFAMALSACGQTLTSSPVPTPVSSEEDILSQQIRLIAESSDLWQAEDEMDWWGYAVTDLDQNGRLELISSETHGTGIFTTTRIWEVSEDMTSLLPCETDEHCGPIFEARSEIDTKSYIIPTYYVASAEKYYYILDDFTKDGAFSGSFLAFRETVWDESGEHISCRDGDGNTITENDYKHIADQYFQDHQSGTTTIKWVQFTHLSDMTHERLVNSLNDSFQAFSIALGTEGLEVSYSEVLQGKWDFYEVLTEQILDISTVGRAMTSDDIPIVAKDFSIIDLDRDGVPEVVLRLAVTEGGNDEIGFVILCYENAQVWGYAIGHRSFLDLKADGSFGFSSGAADWGFGTIALSEDGYEIDRMTYCESVQNSEHSEELYFVNYEHASEKEFQAAVDEHNNKENAAWYDLTSENVAAQLEVKG